jgi:hypothetical protein
MGSATILSFFKMEVGLVIICLVSKIQIRIRCAEFSQV